MRTISKGAEPCCLTAWKRRNSHGAYDDLVDILAAVKRTAIPHHATFLGWSRQRG
ncbi:hypothetical protein [Microcystis sp. M113S1]|jgi:hypothetical protein|uniref:hypothetical protein n=1 Tax=Microcystis sp. M113S1 TaxID=2771104 RepID=UPI00258510C8|nr:hypothetical protein [Microcystis sp. M113S1]